MKVVIEKSRAEGTVNAPPSKSVAHRLLISAGLACGTSRIRGISDCDDVKATADCLRALGAVIERCGDDMIVTGTDMRHAVPRGVLNCRESGSTMRFIIPIALLCGKETVLSGEGKLPSRPMGVYEDICRERGLKLVRDGNCVIVSGTLTGGDFFVRGDVSSQFISGLLFAAPLMETDTRINITTKTESRSYIDMTIDAMSSFGVTALWENENTLYIKGNQKYCPTDVTVEGDYSGTAFTDALSLLGGEVNVIGLKSNSLQGDRIYKEHFEAIERGCPVIDLSDCPDLAPILFTVAAAKNGAKFIGTARLRIKESDRAAVMAEELAKFGASLTVEDNSVTVHRSKLHTPTELLLSHGDHRIVMALATLATLYGGEIDGCEAVNKSYPKYFEDIISLGIKAKIYEN